MLVDLYGEMNALPKLIDDRQVRTKDIRAFLERAYLPDDLSTVDQARALVASHRKALDAFRQAETRNDRLEPLVRKQAERRAKLETARTRLRSRQHAEREALQQSHADTRDALRAAFKTEQRRIRLERSTNRPRGLAAFLGRVTGVTLVVRKLRKFRDRQRLDYYRTERAALVAEQCREGETLHRSHQLQLRGLDRKSRAFDRLERRELRSLETAIRRERRTVERAVNGGRGIPDMLRVHSRLQSGEASRGAERTIRPARTLEDSAARQQTPIGPPEIRDDFSRAASGRFGGTGRGMADGSRRFGARRQGRRRGDDGRER